MDDDLCHCYQPTKPLDLDELAGLEEGLRTISNFDTTVSQLWFLLNFQFHALKLCGARESGTAARRMLTVTICKDLAL